MKTLQVETRDAWRAWLAAHHASETEIWLVFHRARTGKANVPYDEIAEKMLAEGLMIAEGMAFVSEAKVSGEWERARKRPVMPTGELPGELSEALETHPSAFEAFHALAPTYQKQYILWIAAAKRAETRQRRTREAIEKLERGERLGLK